MCGEILQSIGAKQRSFIPRNCKQEEEGAQKQQTAIDWGTAGQGVKQGCHRKCLLSFSPAMGYISTYF